MYEQGRYNILDTSNPARSYRPIAAQSRRRRPPRRIRWRARRNGCVVEGLGATTRSPRPRRGSRRQTNI